MTSNRILGRPKTSQATRPNSGRWSTRFKRNAPPSRRSTSNRTLRRPSERFFVRGWLARPLFSSAGAIVGAGGVAIAEAVRAARSSGAPAGAVALGDLAVLAPMAAVVGLGVAVASMLLDPELRFDVRAAVARLSALEGAARSQAAAVALVAPVAILVWALACAHAGRTAFARSAPAAAGAEVAMVSVMALVFVTAAVVSALPLVARTLTTVIAPEIAAACGATYALACAVV